MADTATSDWSDFFYDQRGPLQEFYGKKHPLTAELKADTSGQSISGEQVRVPILLNELQGGGAIAQGATVNLAQVERTNQAHINLAELVFPVSMTRRLMAQSVANSAVQIAKKFDWARDSLAHILNAQLNGDGTGLLATVTAHTNLVSTVDTDANWNFLKAGVIVDVLTRSTGADAGQGTTRRIASVDRAAGTITFSTTSYGGGSGNITASSASGIYLNGSYGNVVQGIQQVAAATGTFEDIDKAAVQEWQGTDGRAGDTTSLPLSQTMLDAAFVELGYAPSGLMPTPADFFFVGDPKAINKYQQQFYSIQRFPNPQGTLQSGFTGASYNGFTLVPDFDHLPKAVHGVHKPSLQVYRVPGMPDFDNLTGSRYMRFARTTNVETWLVDMAQLGALRCDTLLKLHDLAQAS